MYILADSGHTRAFDSPVVKHPCQDGIDQLFKIMEAETRPDGFLNVESAPDLGHAHAAATLLDESFLRRSRRSMVSCHSEALLASFSTGIRRAVHALVFRFAPASWLHASAGAEVEQSLACQMECTGTSLKLVSSTSRSEVLLGGRALVPDAAVRSSTSPIVCHLLLALRLDPKLRPHPLEAMAPWPYFPFFRRRRGRILGADACGAIASDSKTWPGL